MRNATFKRIKEISLSFLHTFTHEFAFLLKIHPGIVILDVVAIIRVFIVMSPAVIYRMLFLRFTVCKYVNVEGKTCVCLKYSTPGNYRRTPAELVQ